MMRRVSIGLLLTTLVGSVGCGNEGYIILEVHSDLSIPDQIDSLEVQVMAPDGGQDLLLQTVQLVAGQSFPIDVVLTPSDRTPDRVEERVTGLLDAVPVARSRSVHGWERGKVNRALLPQLEPVP